MSGKETCNMVGSCVHIGLGDFESLLLTSNSNVCETTVQVLILILTGVRFPSKRKQALRSLCS